MALTDDDVREILRIIDESELDELRIETDGLQLHVLRAARRPRSSRSPPSGGRGGAGAARPLASEARATISRSHRLPSAPSTAPSARDARRSSRSGTGRAGHDRLHHRGDEDDELGRRGGLRHDRRGLRRERPAGRVRRSRSSASKRMTRVVDIVDTTTRDGNQSLWGATGLTDRRTSSRSRRRWTGSAFARSTSPRARTWRCRCASIARIPGSDPAGAAPRCRHAAQPDHDRNALHLLGASGEDVMRLRSGSRVRNGIRRFQFADPSNDPASLVRARPHDPRGGGGGDRCRPDLLDQPGPHPRLLRRARPRSWRLARTSTGST